MALDTEELEATGRKGSSVEAWESTTEIPRGCALLMSNKHR